MRLDWKVPSIQTFSGAEFFPLDPNPAHIVPEDIAHGIALKCRYTGQCKFFYSIAQHSVLLHDYLADLGRDNEVLRWALMHDTTEAYLPDVASPIKKHIPTFCEIEERLMYAIATRFKMDLPIPSEIKIWDRMMYWRERLELMIEAEWVYAKQDRVNLSQNQIDTIKVEPWSLDRGELEWVVRFNLLFPEEGFRWR